ncbi:unnamed protein product [Mycena citricolor]|uniref:Uncharacterized protein n=1 Tax=Mycena citricolor TaxID=2018698 RepID=A0AAD2H7N4_9AGAR|nr:unnamed protein product [Mycena citricolor]
MSLSVLKTTFEELQRSSALKRKNLIARLAKNKEISSEEKAWLDGDGNLVEEQVVLNKLEAASDYKRGLSCLDSTAQAVVARILAVIDVKKKPNQENPSSSACAAHKSTILFRFPSLSGSLSPPPILPLSPNLAHQNQPRPSNPYLALPPPEDEIPNLDELPSKQPPPSTTPAPTMSGHHRITLAANPPYFNGDKSKYLGFVDACTTYIGAY